MIQLLYTLIFSEMALILILSFKTPIRKLVLLGLDRVKRGHGPIVVRTVAGTIFVVLLSSVHSMMKIQKDPIEEGSVNPTDMVLMGKLLLEATLMGGSLFLGLMIDRLHHYIRELRIRRNSMEAVKKQSRAVEDGVEEKKALEEELTAVRARVKKLESEIEVKTKEAHASEMSAVALRKQSEGFLLEYDRLLAENQDMKDQLQSLDSRLSRSDCKKDT